MKKFAFFIVTCFVIQSGFSQDKIKSTEFLTIHRNLLQTEVMSDLHDQLEDENFKAAFIDDVQVRTETDEFKFRRQRYQLRVSPSTLQMKRTQEKLFQAYRGKYKVEMLELEEQYYLKVYRAWIDNYLFSNKSEAYASSLDLQNKMLKDLIAQSEGGEYKISDHFKIKRSISNLEFDQLKIKAEKDFLRSEYPGLLTASFDDMKSVADIKEMISAEMNPETIQEDQFDRSIAEYELKEVLDEKNKVFDYIQGSYRGPHDNTFSERFSLELGFRLPLAGDNKLEIRERRFDLQLEEKELALRKKYDQIERREQKEQLKNAISRYEKKAGFYEREKNLYEKLKTAWIASGGSVEEMLEMERVQLMNAMDLMEAEEDVWEQYLDFLETEKLLQIRPLVDYLSKIEKVIED